MSRAHGGRADPRLLSRSHRPEPGWQVLHGASRASAIRRQGRSIRVLIGGIRAAANRPRLEPTARQRIVDANNAVTTIVAAFLSQSTENLMNVLSKVVAVALMAAAAPCFTAPAGAMPVAALAGLQDQAAP